MLRVNVWVILVFTISTVDAFGPMSLMFSPDTVEDNDRRVDGVSDDSKAGQAIAVEPTDHFARA